MLKEDTYQDQPVAFIRDYACTETKQSVKKGAIGFNQGYSTKRDQVLVLLKTGQELYTPLNNLIGVL